MFRLATVVGTHSLPYEELSNELVAGIFDLHWNEEAGTFFDYGKHISDGKVIDEAIMRCQKGEMIPTKESLRHNSCQDIPVYSPLCRACTEEVGFSEVIPCSR